MVNVVIFVYVEKCYEVLEFVWWDCESHSFGGAKWLILLASPLQQY